MQHLDDFINFLRYGRNMSDLSVRQYTFQLNIFHRWLNDIHVPEKEIKQSDIFRYMMIRCANGTKAVTVNHGVVIIRRYYDYCLRFHSYPVNPAVGVEPLRVPKLLPKFIPRDVIMKAVGNLDVRKFDDVCAAAIIMTMFCTGLRKSELQNLSYTDVDMDNRCVRVFGKGRKERICPIPNALLPYLDRWIDFRARDVSNSPLTFFCNSAGEPIRDKKLKLFIKRVFMGFCDPKLAHPHALRHSFATVMMQAGVPIPDISRLMGHNSTATTLKYLSLSPQSMYLGVVDNVF